MSEETPAVPDQPEAPKPVAPVVPKPAVAPLVAAAECVLRCAPCEHARLFEPLHGLPNDGLGPQEAEWIKAVEGKIPGLASAA